MNVIASIRTRIAAADPGLGRLMTAIRAVVSVCFTLLLMEMVARAAGLPPTVDIIGAAVAMQSSIAVNDRDRNAQRLTTGLLLIVAPPAVLLAILASPHPRVSDGVFLALIFIGIYIRRFGPRYFALGMIPMFAYFFSVYLHLTMKLFPWAVLSQVIGIAVAFIVRFLIFPDRADVSLRSAATAFIAGVSLLAGALHRAARAGCWSAKDDRLVSNYLLQLNNAALVADSILSSSEKTTPEADRVRAAMVDAEVAAADVASATHTAIDCDTHLPPEALQTLAFLEKPSGLIRIGDGEDELPRTADAVQASAADLVHSLRDLATEIAHIQVNSPEWVPRINYNITSKAERLQPTTRQAIQATIAAAAAIVIGEVVSSTRWYWAVLAVVVVYAGTWSRGAALSKAWSRIVGTLIGIGVGMGLVQVVGSSKPLVLALILVCLFGFVYFIRTSYGTAVAFLTTMLAGLYAELGMMSAHILLLRLIETSIGALLGFLAAGVVLPMRTRDVVREAVVEALHRLSEVASKSVDSIAGDGRGAEAIDASRRFDEALHNLQGKMQPYAVQSVLGDDSSQQWLMTLSAAGYYARMFSRAAFRAASSQKPEIDEAMVSSLRAECRTLCHHIDRVIDVINGKQTPATAGETSSTRPQRQIRRGEPLDTLRHIDRTVRELGECAQ